MGHSEIRQKRDIAIRAAYHEHREVLDENIAALKKVAVDELDVLCADVAESADTAAIEAMIHEAFDRFTSNQESLELVAAPLVVDAFAALRRRWHRGPYHCGDYATRTIYNALAERQDECSIGDAETQAIDALLALRRLMGAGTVTDAVRALSCAMTSLGIVCHAANG